MRTLLCSGGASLPCGASLPYGTYIYKCSTGNGSSPILFDAGFELLVVGLYIKSFEIVYIG